MSTIVLSEKKVEEELGGLWRLLKIYFALNLSRNGQDSAARDVAALAVAAVSPIPLPEEDSIVEAAKCGLRLIKERYPWAT
ncbi:MAG: hypothetical protein ACE5J0_00390 [Candidatus Paceibacterales bacterium]